ncbi:MAG: isoleucine--tRNA ligase [Anaerolineae bacterium]
MRFNEVSSQVDFPALEQQILKGWKEKKTFERSVEQRKGGPSYVFYEGPPTANGLPHIGHALTRVVKDLFPRYKTMRGFYSLRKGGWDTHGLPVEIEIEKELGFSGKQAIEAYGVAEFNARCRESVFRYVKEWVELSDRLGFWIDMDHPYVTLTNEYIESVWWILKQLWDRDLLYQGYKSLPYCPRCGTALSDHEVAQGYREVEDPGITIRFPLRDEPGTYFLVWTTTPWTLPGNVALAVGENVWYAIVEQKAADGESERLILAEALVHKVILGEHRTVGRIRGRELAGTHYQPLYTFLPIETDYAYVLTGDFVSVDEGTGIVHIAPAFGAEDLEVGKEYGLPILQTVNLEGRFVEAVTPWRGLFVKDADPLIIEDLKSRGLLYEAALYSHVYPFCWRCQTPLLYYAKTSWFIETTRIRDRLLANNEKINWYPEHIKNGRFGNWLENNVDWALGRERYWGTPLPIWECAECHHRECFGGIAELTRRLASEGRAPEGVLCGPDPQTLDLHRPYVDAIHLRCPQCGGTMSRVPEVIDCWFDSGAMPVAQWHYPFENQEIFREQFPADFISEAVDQTRGWFYSLHAISVLLFDEPCYRNCVVLGLILDEDGEKMSKSKGNSVDPWDVIHAHGSDALRWYLYTASPPGLERRVSVGLVGDVVRRFLLTLWNTYSFFVTYANIDGFDPTGPRLPWAARSVLDRWILSELNQLVARVTEALENYDITGAARPIEKFVDNLSNWYVRRSRRRFWKSEADADKAAAYQTLYECLVTLCKLLAPFTPFVADAMYQNLVLSVYPDAPDSVHLTDFPLANKEECDPQLIADTQLAMRVVGLGRSARNQAGIKVRQPLARVWVKPRSPEDGQSLVRLKDQILDELNVKDMELADDATTLVEYRVSAVPSLVGRRLGALFPKARAALAALSPSEVAARVGTGEPVELTVEGQKVRLTPEEVQVEMHPREGFAVAEEAGCLVALDTRLTDELIQEGRAREVVRQIQTLRKEAGFRIEDRIVTYWQGGPLSTQLFARWGNYIQRETLTETLAPQPPPLGSTRTCLQLDGEALTLAVLPLQTPEVLRTSKP